MDDPPVPCVTWNVIFCPSVGLVGLPMVRLAAMVTRKSLPSEASTAIVAASVSATTAGATAADSTVVPPCRARRRGGEDLSQHGAPCGAGSSHSDGLPEDLPAAQCPLGILRARPAGIRARVA